MRPMTMPGDTSRAARELQLAAYRAMGGNRRLQAALQMSEEIRRVAAAGVRARHPDWPSAKVDRAVSELLIGGMVATRAR